MAKITLQSVLSGFNLSKINANFSAIQSALNDKVLWRDNPLGEPNTLHQDLDVNGFTLLNVGSLSMNGVDIQEKVDAAAASAAAALAAQEAAEASDESAALREASVQNIADSILADTEAADQARIDAQAAATAADVSEASALGYRNEAEGFKNQAGTSATNAATSEVNALSYRNTAETHKNNASTYAGNASTSATNASTSATLASEWAIKTSGTVNGSEYSAKYHAQQAAASAIAAATFDPAAYVPKAGGTYTGAVTFSGGITGALTGNASTATRSNTVDLTHDAALATTHYIPFGSGTTGVTLKYNGNMTFVPSTGVFSSVVVTQTSDERKKKDWKRIEGLVEKVASLEKVGSFKWIDNDQVALGVGAQSLEAILPEGVYTDEHGNKTVAYGAVALVLCVELAKELVRLKESK